MRETERTPQKGKNGPLQVLGNVLGVILCIVFIPIIILNVVMIVRSYTDSEHIPSVFGYSPVVVLSGSMSHTFETGDMILLQKVDPANLKVGDVICFKEEETVVTHRIMEIQNSEDGTPMYITKGDANNAEDLVPVFPDQVQGIYTGVRLPGLGYFANFLQEPLGMILFIGGPVLLLLLWDVFRRSAQGRRSSRETKRLQEESAGREQELAAMEQELERLRAQVKNEARENEEDGEGGI